MCDDCGEKARITSIKAALLAYQAYNTNTVFIFTHLFTFYTSWYFHRFTAFSYTIIYHHTQQEKGTY